MEAPFKVESNDDGIYAIRMNHLSVAVILYTLDEDQALDTIGVLTEKNPFFLEGEHKGTVMGTVEPDDETLLQRAQKEVLEESGFDVTDDDKWDYLGELYTSKLIPTPIYCFSVDVSGLERTTPKGDGSNAEKGIKFDMVEMHVVPNINDSVFQSCFSRLFNKQYKQYLS